MCRGAPRLIVVALLLGSLALGMMAFGEQPAAAGTLVVDDNHVQCPSATYTTISAAVAAANPGDTIQVCAGLYNEQVQINKNNLTLLGAQAGVDARTRPFIPDPTTQSIIEHPCGPVQLEANNLELNGFTVQGATLPDPCFMAGIWSNPSFSGTQGGFRILYDIVQDNVSGIELDSNCGTTTLVQYDLIQNNSNPGPGSGNGIQTNFGLCNATIDRNKFSGDTSSSVLVLGPPATSVASGIDVTNNELVAPTPEGISFLGVSTSTISGNVSTGSTNDGTIHLFGNDSHVLITGNALLNGMRAILVDNPFEAGVNSDITAHQNCIQGNSVAGLEVDLFSYSSTGPPLNAENNWWGSASGPNEVPGNPSGTGDRIIDPEGNVDFTPWLTTPTAPPCPQLPPPNTPGKVTGGGQVQGDPLFSPLGELISLPALMPIPGNPPVQATFGFISRCCAPAGNLEYNDHQADVRIKALSMTGLVISSPGTSCPATPRSQHARFTGTANVYRVAGTTTEPFTVDVDDCGEPGTADTFHIQTTTYSSGAPATLIGGNIQIHRQ